MSALLLRPFLYLKIKHASSTMPWMNWGLPALVSAGLVGTCALAAPTVNAFHAGGVFDRLLGFIQTLPGFYLAALAAVATFNRPSLDQLMPGTPPKASVIYQGKPLEVDLTRRRFLSLIFSYLTALSFAIALLLAVGLPLVEPLRSWVPQSALEVLRAVASFGLLLFIAQLIVVTFWGLYYLGERMHTPD